MKPNRRNFYRILHVQPEAPIEVIRASVRTLLGPLRMHPDKGGDHDKAVAINEAWRVLGDPALRAAYDRTLATPRRQRAGEGPVSGGPDSFDADSRDAGSRDEGSRDSASHGPGSRGEGSGGAAFRNGNAGNGASVACPFCRALLAGALSDGARCARCDAPLSPAPDRSDIRSPAAARDVASELFGRRRSRRIAREVPLVVHVEWDSVPLAGSLCDLSFEGASFDTARRLAAGSVVRIVSRELDALVQVVGARTMAPAASAAAGANAAAGTARLHRHHARLLTVAFTRRQGVFVSTMA